MVVLVLRLPPKDFVWVAKIQKEILNIRHNMIIQINSQGREEALPYVSCMGALAACLTQTIVAHATSRGIHIDSIDINVEGDVDLRGFTGISNEIRPGAQQFRVNMNIKSNNASNEQINELREIGKRFSPAFDTLTN